MRLKRYEPIMEIAIVTHSCTHREIFVLLVLASLKVTGVWYRLTSKVGRRSRIVLSPALYCCRKTPWPAYLLWVRPCPISPSAEPSCRLLRVVQTASWQSFPSWIGKSHLTK